MLGPMVKSSCFSFESAHNFFKELARKQNFKNLALSLAKRHQFNLCCNFGDGAENPSSHPLFSSEKTYGILKKANAEMCRSLWERFDLHGCLPGIEFVNVYKVSWIKLFGIKYAKSVVMYFDVRLVYTQCFDHQYQGYRVTDIEND